MDQEQKEHEMRMATYNALINTQGEYLKILADSGKLAVQSSIILNGGAAVAIMALVGNVIGDRQNNIVLIRTLLEGAGYFAQGAIIAALSAGAAYCTNFLGVLDYAKQSEYILKNDAAKGKMTRLGIFSIFINCITAFAVAASYARFYQGLSVISNGFSQMMESLSK